MSTRTEFRMSTSGFLRDFVPHLMCAGIFLFLAVPFGIWHFTRPQANTGIASLVCAGIALPFIGMIFKALGESAVEVRLTPDELVWRSQSDQCHVPWDTIREVYRRDARINGILQRTARIVITGGRELALSHRLDDYDALVAALDKRLAPGFAKAALEALARGEDAPFGPVTVHPDGLTVKPELYGVTGTRRVAFRQIRGIQLMRGMLLIYPHEKPHSNCDFLPVPLATIPNCAALLEVVGRAMQPAQPA